MIITTRVKLWILIACGVVAIVATGLGLGVRALWSATVDYHTYFDESVQGLDLGSPVKYRGVAIGRVADISIAPDRKHVDVVLALRSEHAARLGLAATLPELRAQLGTQGVTGVKFVDIDFFDPKANPPPALTFEPAHAYIPARASLIKSLEDNLEAIGPRLPALVDRADAALAKMSRVLDEIGDARLGERFARASDDAAGALEAARQLAQRFDGARLDTRAATVLDRATASLQRLDGLVARLDGVSGLVTSAKRATDSLGDLGRSSLGSTEELDRTLRELGDAARAVHDLADTIHRQPDVLVKGRARSGKP